VRFNELLYNKFHSSKRPHPPTKTHHQVIKWALQASTRETSSFLIEKGKRDARAWVVATGLEPLLAHRQKQHQMRSGGDGEGLILPGGYRGSGVGAEEKVGATVAGREEEQQQQQEGGEADNHSQRKRHREEEDSGAEKNAGAAAPVPGLTGEPRTDTAPLHDKAPAR